ncbi:MAG: integration host factor subunit beta [Candidatus Aureabacteria bacterium]|nr:integration host factor subunit beta [Candidatus Auribacterota bacterium]
MTKREIVMKISSETGLTQVEVKRVVQRTFDLIIEALKSGDKVELRNFGVFQVKRRKKRLGRNPNKPEEVIPIPEKNVPDFKPGKIMKEKVERTT